MRNNNSDLAKYLLERVLERKVCSTCGQPMVQRDEVLRELDPRTGERKVEHWWECARYPRNGLIFMLRGFRQHDSLSLDNPLIGKSYR